MKIKLNIVVFIKIILISFSSIFLLTACSNKPSISTNDSKILNNIVTLINETYYTRNYLVDAKVTEDEFWTTLIECYEKDVKNLKLTKDNISLLDDENLKTSLENYYKGAKLRLDAYKHYRDNNLDSFKMLLLQADTYIYPSIITLIEDFEIDANKPLKKEYDFIKSKS